MLPGSVHAPYPDLQGSLEAGGLLHELSASTARTLVFYCAFGERSAMAVEAARDAGFGEARHLHGGVDAWKKAGALLDSA